MISRGIALATVILVFAMGAIDTRADYPGSARQHHRSDEQIKIAVLRGVVANPNAFVANLDVQVQDGVVALAGSVRTRSARRTVEALAKSVPGVAEVRNHLTIVAP